MLKYLYWIYGIGLLFLYTLSGWEGWEFRNPQRFQPPGLVSGGTSGGGRSFWYWRYGDDRSGSGWSSGGK